MDEIRKEIKRLLEILTGPATGDLDDDGRDSGDEIQNAAFSASLRNMEDAVARLARISIPGVENEVLDELWRKTSQGSGIYEKLNHGIFYGNALLELLDEKDKSGGAEQK